MHEFRLIQTHKEKLAENKDDMRKVLVAKEQGRIFSNMFDKFRYSRNE